MKRSCHLRSVLQRSEGKETNAASRNANTLYLLNHRKDKIKAQANERTPSETQVSLALENERGGKETLCVWMPLHITITINYIVKSIKTGDRQGKCSTRTALWNQTLVCTRKRADNERERNEESPAWPSPTYRVEGLFTSHWNGKYLASIRRGGENNSKNMHYFAFKSRSSRSLLVEENSSYNGLN